MSMSLYRRRVIAWIVIGLFSTLGLIWLARLDYGKKISTDVLDLIPAGERDPQLALVRELASKAEARTMLFVLTEGGGRQVPVDIARRFAEELGRAPAFNTAVALADSTWRDALGHELFALRFSLLFPLWLRHQRDAFEAARATSFTEWLAERAARELGEFLSTPEALAFQDLIPSDPLLLLPRTLTRLRGAVFSSDPGADQSGLVWAQIAASPLSEEGQQPVFAAIAEARAALTAEAPSLAVAYTGVNRFAHVSRTRIQGEVTWLNTASLLAVFAVAILFIPRFLRSLHLVPVVLLALLAGWVATTMAFERVHIIVLVIGALLAGIAIDYGFHIFAHPPARAGEPYLEKLRRLLKPLLASCLSTAVGFGFLLLTDLPLLRQLGVFVMAGLIGAAVFAGVYFATLESPFLVTRSFGWRPPRGARAQRRFRLVVGAIALVALPGLARISWQDDIRELEVPAPELKREDAQVRAAFGEQTGRTVLLTHGRTLDDARVALNRLESWYAGRGTTIMNLGVVIPTAADYAAAIAFVREPGEFARILRASLQRQGFDAGEFAPFFSALSRFAAENAAGDRPAAIARFRAKLVGPAGLLLHGGPALSWFISIVNTPAAAPPPAEFNTIPVSQLQSLNELFTRYRKSAVTLSAGGLGLIGVGVLLAYGWREGRRIFAIPAGVCLGVLGAFGWMGHPLNLFHLLGAFLAVCLTHDYAIFSAAMVRKGEPAPPSVRLSALTTAASFGVLACSAIPVVRALGLTVALMVLGALLVIEREPRRGVAGEP